MANGSGVLALCFIFLMSTSVMIFWFCGLILSIFELTLGSIALSAASSASGQPDISSYGACQFNTGASSVPLIPLYLVVSGGLWTVWTVCSALVRCTGDRACGFYVGAGDLKVHCYQKSADGPEEHRHMGRKFVANVLLMSVISWLVAGTIFLLWKPEGLAAGPVFDDPSSSRYCSRQTFEASRVCLIIRWAWLAFVALVHLLLKVMQYIMAH